MNVTKASIAGEEFLLLPDHGVYWPRERTLIVADLHLGKSETFNRHSIPIPDGPTQSTVSILDRMIEAIEPDQVLILGDLWHSRSGITEATRTEFSGLLSRHESVRFMLVPGNHDVSAGVLSGTSIFPPNFQITGEEIEISQFRLRHDFSGSTKATNEKFCLSGHVHPAVRMVGSARRSEVFKCLWVTEQFAVLPSFGLFTGSKVIQPRQCDAVYVFSENTVLAINPQPSVVKCS